MCVFVFAYAKIRFSHDEAQILSSSKIGVDKGIHYFLICALKHKAVLTCTHNLCLRKNRKITSFFSSKINILTAFKNHCILHRHIYVIKLFDSIFFLFVFFLLILLLLLLLLLFFALFLLFFVNLPSICYI